MAKIFISYKYDDEQVSQGLDQKYWATETDELSGITVKETKATGRAYVNLLEEIIGKENILKGEKQDESLEGKTDHQIWEILKSRIHDSSITLVVVSKGMKESSQDENGQWIPTEIRYSLWEVSNGGRRSSTNALLGVIIPDCAGRYDYIYGRSSCPHCRDIKVLDKQNNPYLFNILKSNIFNRKNDDGSTCKGELCSLNIYTGDHSYLHLVTLEDFIKDRKHQEYIDKALEIKGNGDRYEIEKTI